MVDQLNALRGDRSTEYERFRDGSRDSSVRFFQFNSVLLSISYFFIHGEYREKYFLRECKSRNFQFDSIDEIDDDAGSRSLDRPLRPPPPTLRSSGHGPPKVS